MQQHARTHECKISIATRHLCPPARLPPTAPSYCPSPIRPSASVRRPFAGCGRGALLSFLPASLRTLPLLRLRLIRSRRDNEFHSAALRADPIHFRWPPPSPPPQTPVGRRQRWSFLKWTAEPESAEWLQPSCNINITQVVRSSPCSSMPHMPQRRALSSFSQLLNTSPIFRRRTNLDGTFGTNCGVVNGAAFAQRATTNAVLIR